MKSFLRFLKRNPLYTAINIAGLAVALMFVILIGDYAWRQFSVDASQPNKGRIVLMGNNSDFLTWPDVSEALAQRYPEIEKTCRVVSQGGTIRTEDTFYKDENRSIMMIADSTFFDMFRFRFREGDPATALSAPDRVVITESLARALFPEGNSVGRPLRLIGQRSVRFPSRPDPYDSTLVYTVSGVVADFDRTVFPNSTRIIVPMERYQQVLGYEMSNDVFVSTGHGCFKTFYLLHEGAELDSRADEIKEYIRQNVSARFFNEEEMEWSFTPLRKIMFSPSNNGRGLMKGDKGLLTVLLSAIIAILAFAVTNYINLTVANTGMRAREMATRQLLGSGRNAIILKLICESVLMVLAAFLLGLLLAFIFDDDLASMFRGKIMLAKDLNPGTVGACAAFVVVTGVLAGLIPGLQTAAYRPIDVVKGTFRYRSKMVFSRIFIMLQNIITVVMLTASLVIMLQIRGLVNAPMGFNTKDIVVVRPGKGEHEAVRETLAQLPCVQKTGRYEGTCPLDYSASMTFLDDIEGNSHIVFVMDMDKEAMEIYGMEILRDFGASPGARYVNEEMCRQFAMEDDATEVVTSGRSIPVAGVIKDFRRVSVLNDFDPFMITLKESEEIAEPYYVVRTDGSRDALKKIMEALDGVMLNIDPSYSVIEWNDDYIYHEERNLMHIVFMFTVIAILISILGFIGMSLFFIRQRRSELAVRRIMGGSITEIIVLMLTKFCAPLFISVVAAVPAAYIIMNRWLEGFSYRISLDAWIFAVTGLLSIVIAVLSVLWQTSAAVRVNPAESIKTE